MKILLAELFFLLPDLLSHPKRMVPKGAGGRETASEKVSQTDVLQDGGPCVARHGHVEREGKVEQTTHGVQVAVEAHERNDVLTPLLFGIRTRDEGKEIWGAGLAVTGGYIGEGGSPGY